MENSLLIFARCPDRGRCKTRLIPALGEEGAAALHEKLVARTLSAVQSMGAPRSVHLLHTGANLDRLKSICSAAAIYAEYSTQVEGDLGRRLAAAFDDRFAAGLQRVIAVGTDCPDLTGRLLDQALDALERTELVIGPAADGGYYLIGLNRSSPQLFADIPWGGPGVLAATMQAAELLNLSVERLPLLSDVDEPEDLPICIRHGLL